MFIAVGTPLAEDIDKVFVDGVEVYAINIDTEKGIAEVYDKEMFEVKQIKGKIEIIWKKNKGEIR